MAQVVDFSRPANHADLVLMAKQEWALLHGVVLSDEDAERIASGIEQGCALAGVPLVSEDIEPLVINEQEGC